MFVHASLLLLVACGGTQEGGKPVITTFGAEPPTVSQGETSTLSWSVTGADTLNLTPGDIDVSGEDSYTVTPDTTTTYTLSATNKAGSSQKQTTVTVEVEALEPKVNPEVTPTQTSIPDKDGNPQEVAGSKDARGVQTDFVVGQVLIKPKSDADLTDFLSSYDGTVIGDNTVPEPPESLGISLSEEERRATEYLVRINLSKVDPDKFAADAAAVGMGGVLEISSQDGLLTLAGATNALAAGFDVSPNYVSYPQQTFPAALFRTEERPDGAGGFNDAFTTTRFQGTGSQSNVTLAWQFVMAHGISRRVRVAIIDDGFWLNPNGTPRGTDSDLPANPIQYDFFGNDYLADGPNGTGCGAGNPCFWHGTGAAGVATGILNNRLGAAGTGGLIADPILLKASGQRSQINWAIRTAVAWGADVVSMSFGGDCDSVACRRYDRNNTPVSDAINSGSRTVFIAAAGNNNHEVGAPFFVHPCIEDHVICVGALNDDATTRIGYSNFGGGVDLYAPTNLPVMTQPASNDSNPNGPAAPQSFGGTSASTPFVAGVAALMKAVNPNLNNDQVAQILRDTAHRGAAPVDFYIDAYAAVRRAAEGIDGVKDRFEPNGPTLPSQLTGPGPWTNLNLHNAQDRDYYRFDSSGRSTLRIDLSYPETLGAIPWLGLNGNDACGVPALTTDAPLPGGGRRLEYTVAAGPHTLSLGGGLINAYNLSLSFSAASALAPDSYESNDTPGTARYLYSFKPVGTDPFRFYAIDPAVSVDVNLHTSSDVDYYQVQGVTTTLAQQVLFNGGPIVEVYSNESAATLEVYTLNPDNTQGTLVGRASNARCGSGSLSVPVESGKSYLVKVSGAAGRYTLFNGVRADPRRLPEWVRDRLYLVLNPGDPVEGVIRTPLIYLFTGDETFSDLNVQGDVHLELYDAERTLLAEGVSSAQGERLVLEGLTRDALYALQVTPVNLTEAGTPMTLSWESSAPERVSDNLIQNPGAEEGPGNDGGGAVDFIEGWAVPSDFVSQPTVVYYNGVNGLPSEDSPGSEKRGFRLFAGGPDTDIAAIQQQLIVPEDWRAAVESGTVKVNLSAFLGGNEDQADAATLSATFFDANLRELGKFTLGPVTAGAREGKTGLFPVAGSAFMPTSTYSIYIDLEFTRAEGDYNDGYADELELTLSDYSP